MRQVGEVADGLLPLLFFRGLTAVGGTGAGPAARGRMCRVGAGTYDEPSRLSRVRAVSTEAGRGTPGTPGTRGRGKEPPRGSLQFRAETGGPGFSPEVAGRAGCLDGGSMWDHDEHGVDVVAGEWGAT